MSVRDSEAMIRGKSQVQLNYERDPRYNPYCMRCIDLRRMVNDAPYLWHCPKCLARCDLRDEREKFLHCLLIPRLESVVQEYFAGDATGHDWDHTDRVRRMALLIARRTSGARLDFVEAAALVHDAGDWKLTQPTDVEFLLDPLAWQRQTVVTMLTGTQAATSKQADQIAEIVCSVSFKGAGVPDQAPNLEAQCVMDADRLDAMGAIGVARCFMYGATHGRPIYKLGAQPELHTSFEAYRSNDSSSLNHFFEKLLLLKDRMQTDFGRELAEKRHEFLLQYVSTLQLELSWIYDAVAWGAELLTPSTAPSATCVNCGCAHTLGDTHPNLCNKCFEAATQPPG